ncbi:hypothetical protein OIV83_006095 [Microbotryomycetes sp. JL201]|nr:hypothetical protein OIV83_006095 [Microbotryomycetes sp. JL201]
MREADAATPRHEGPALFPIFNMSRQTRDSHSASRSDPAPGLLTSGKQPLVATATEQNLTVASM